ncbi:fibronectin type III domain-containing protein [Marinobacter salexigens]|uniref:fibronectin type III domain-containing protein n=1 Tax=Marinobacter salexigens TaxID=1925763 RepID=UPI001EFD7BD6|nr:fibronectin type III domain-containing protein [Marinobacter salexigens]
MPFIKSTRMSLLTIALSTLLTACGGGDSSAPATQAPSPSVTTPGDNTSSGETQEQKFWVEGYAVKGAINGGLISIWHHELGPRGSDWVKIGETVKTNGSGGFRISVPEAYSAQPLKVILQSDAQTLMRCDAQPACNTPAGRSVNFGEWFSPGDNLQLKSLAVPSRARQGVVLTPLVTLAFEKFLKAPEGGAPLFNELLRDQEELFGLAPGALTNKPFDLAAPDLSRIQTQDLKAALLNIAFLSLVDGREWRTLGDVLLAAVAASEPDGDLPLSIDDSPILSVDMLVLASIKQAEALTDVLKEAGVQDGVLADTIASLKETLNSTMPSAPPAAETDPDLPETPAPGTEPTPETEPETETPLEPQPETGTAPGGNPDTGTTPELEPDTETTPETEAPTKPVTGFATMSWNAPATRVDGKSLAMGEIDKYIVKYGTERSIDERTNEVVVEDGQAMEYRVADLTEGTWYFAMKTVDTNGLESDWSVTVSKTISR